MALQKTPYFMKNKEWYTYNEEKHIYELTDKAPQEAINSYNDFYKKLNRMTDDNFNIDDLLENNAMSLFGLQGGNNDGKQ